MAFELYKTKYSKIRNPLITLNPNTGINFNKASLSLLGNATHVDILFDNEKSIIKILILKTPNIYSYKLVKQGTSVCILCKSFMKEIKLKELKRFPFIFNNKEKSVLININAKG